LVAIEEMTILLSYYTKLSFGFHHKTKISSPAAQLFIFHSM